MVYSRRWLLTFALFCAFVLNQITARSQEGMRDFKVGQRIEYKESAYSSKWHPGTIIKLLPHPESNLFQVLVRWEPRADYPGYTHNGVSAYEQAYNVTDIRHPIPTTPAKAPATGAQVITDNSAGNGAVSAGGKGPMSKAEIINYLRLHGYANGQPKRDPQVAHDLIEQIKARGVVDRIVPGPDSQPFAENGYFNSQDTDVVGATGVNLGPPTTLSWLAGTWIMYVIGGTVDHAPGDGYIYRKNESIAKLGFLTINSNGTYVWKVNPGDSPAKYARGSWRKATKEEMKLQGGAGLVLQKAAEGADWIVFKYMDPFKKAERIEVEHSQFRGSYRRIGWRR